MTLFDELRSLPPEIWQHPLVLAFVAFFGAIWGSFLNVCIYRIPAELSVIHPGSHCFACKKPVAFYDNIPVLSWLILRGKCRNCGAKFSVRYAIVELISGLLFAAIWMKYGPTWVTLCYGLMSFGLLLGSGVDLDHFWIPDRVTWGGILIGIPLSFLVPELHNTLSRLDALKASALGAAVGFGLLWAVGWIGSLVFKKDAMGFGDVKLLGAIGAFLGWPAVLFVVFASSLLGSIFGLTFIALGKSEMGGRIPFGPYLAGAALGWILGGDQLFWAYFRWITATPPA
jgi:leader peptidase (prepilin peptidase)/N-methyltransferase